MVDDVVVRVTKTDALPQNSSPAPQANDQISRPTLAITASLFMLSRAIESVQSANSGTAAGKQLAVAIIPRQSFACFWTLIKQPGCIPTLKL